MIVSAPAELFERVDTLIARLDAPPTADDTSIVTVKLESARAREVAASLSDALPPTIKVTITPVDRANSLMLTGSDEAINLVMAQIQELDAQPLVSPVEFKRIVLQHAIAFDLALTLRQLVRELPSDPDDPRPAISYARTENSILVQATSEQIKAIEDIVAELDVPGDEDRSTEFVALRFADAEQTASALQVFYGPLASIQTTPEAERVSIIAVPISNSLVISAADGEWPGIRSLLEKFDSEDYDTSRQLEIIPLKYADAASVARAMSDAFNAPPSGSARKGASPER